MTRSAMLIISSLGPEFASFILFGCGAMRKEAVVLTLQVRRIGLTVNEGLSDCHPLKGLLQVALCECLAPLLGTPGVGRPSGDVPAAGEVLHDLLEHRTEGLAGVTRAARWVAQLKDLAWHDEASNVIHPGLHLGVELEHVVGHYLARRG